MPEFGICVNFLDRRNSGVSPLGAHPPAFRPYSLWVLAS